MHMTLLTWSETLTLGFPPMDDLHKEFVDRLCDVEHSSDTELPSAWAKLVACTERLFERENGWMRSSQFSSTDNHTIQHRVVLNIMREGLAMARAGQSAEVHTMATELASWFAKHIQSLDAALALHMRTSGLAADPRNTLPH